MKLLLSILLIFTQSLYSQTAPFFSVAQLKKLDSIATQDVPLNAPGIATAIIQNGKLVYEKYAGYADFADSSLITNSTRFNIASNGKQFTALAILTLLDAKKLKLTDDIGNYFPALFPNQKEKITIQSLLNHTSGIRDCYDLWSLQGYTWWKQSFSNADVLKLLEQQEELNFQTGTSYLYSNTNYILLALLVEKVSGKTFVEYTNGMFRKLNMPNTSFEADHTKIRGPIARSYFNFGTWTTYDWIWNVCGDGNIFSTLEDQIQWEKIVQGKVTTKLKTEIIKKSQQPIEGSSFKNYGYGLEFGKYKELDYVFHEGATGAWKATVTRFPLKKTTIITLTNTGKSIPSMQTRQMVDVVFNLKPDAAYLVTKPARVGQFVSDDDIVGTYLTESDFAFQFEKRDNKMFLKRVGRNDVELEREADNIFQQKFDPAFKQEFTLNEKGEKQVTAYYINHAPYSLMMSAAIRSDFDFTNLDGNYFNSETNTIIGIKHLEGVNFEITRNDKKSKGLLVSENKMLAGSYTFNFKERELFLNGDRIKRVRYKKK